MRCLSCDQETTASDAKLFRTRILLCGGCDALATKAQRELEVDLQRAELRAFEWLEHHVLKGGLLTGGDGYQKRRAAARPMIPSGHGPQPHQD